MEHPFQDASAAGPSSSCRNIQQYDGLDNANVGNDMAVEGNRDGTGSSDQGGVGDDELDYYSVKKLVSDISGVVSVSDDMCINSCHAFTGPFAHLDSCSICGEPRYDPHQLLLGKNVPHQKQCNILLGPQLQTRR